ncbi:MAG: hypothetical protein WCJ61_09685 [Paludibacter sp.]
MRTKFIIISFLVLVAKSQSQIYSDLNARVFNIISDKGDTIQFLKTDTCLTNKKPTIIFLQGSRPIPLIIDWGEFKFIPSINNFDYGSLSKKYNIIVISKPNTPAMATKKQLDNQYNYISREDTTKEASKYLRNDLMQNYVSRATKVIEYLVKQTWVDASNILIVGHSEGANISILLSKNKYVKAIGYLSGNPDGGFSKYVKETKFERYTLKRSSVAVQDSINSLYNNWKQKCSYNSRSTKNKDYYNSKIWLSFAGSLRDEITIMKKPIFIAYGTEDMGSAVGNDLLPIYFMSNSKTNYKMMPMVGCGHNFEEISPEGVPNYEKMHWDDVMNGFVKWWETLDK